MRLSEIYYTSEILVDAYVQNDSISKNKKAAEEAKKYLDYRIFYKKTTKCFEGAPHNR